MAAQQVKHDRAGLPGPPLPTSHWTVFEPVRWPGRSEDRIDEVVVGPSGVHVVLHHEAPEGDVSSSASIVRRAGEAADAVAALLPGRYREALRPVVCLCETRDVAEAADGVQVTSPEPLRHALRHQPRVLSTSEVTEVSARLRLALTPYPCPPVAAAVRSLRRLWLRTAAAAIVTAAAATLLVELGPGRLW